MNMTGSFFGVELLYYILFVIFIVFLVVGISLGFIKKKNQIRILFAVTVILLMLIGYYFLLQN
jgi:low affinity Fe/Cu permease